MRAQAVWGSVISRIHLLFKYCQSSRSPHPTRNSPLTSLAPCRLLSSPRTSISLAATMSVVASPPSSSSSYPRPPTRSPSGPSPVSSVTATNESVRPLRRPRRHPRHQTIRLLKFPIQQFARVLDAVDPFVECVPCPPRLSVLACSEPRTRRPC